MRSSFEVSPEVFTPTTDVEGRWGKKEERKEEREREPT
jgi:hypothetical protein